MQPTPAADGRMEGKPPPDARLSERLRRGWKSLGAYIGMRHWLLVRGTFLAAGFMALFVANGFVLGWKTTYDVTIGITSPGDPDVTVPVLAWLMSVAGWLAAPAVAGGVAGAVISNAITNRRQRPIGEVLTKGNRT